MKAFGFALVAINVLCAIINFMFYTQTQLPLNLIVGFFNIGVALYILKTTSEA